MHRAFQRIEGAPTPIEGAPTPIDRASRVPWATALNRTARTDDITVTLLAFTVLEEVVHVSGLLRLTRRSDMRLSNLPTLTLVTLDGAPLELLQAHALPNGPMFWMSWTFGRPADVYGEYEGRIDHVDLAQSHGTTRDTVSGPWVFTFGVAKRNEPGRRPVPPRLFGEA
ncbi:MAG: hypothetical protein ACXWXV_11245 [Aeromicrobium sp.]